MQSTGIEQENVELVRRGFEAFAARDMATLAQIFHPDARWRSAPSGVIGGDRNGRDDVFAMFAQLGAESNGSFASVPNTMAASGNTVFARCIATGQRNGKRLETEQVLVFTIDDGKVRELSLFSLDYPANTAFWS